MSADPRVYLHDILAAIAGARDAIADADLATYRKRRPMKRAVEREIEILSEASRRVPQALKDVPWHEIAGIGNVLRHDYETVSDPVVWNVVHEHLPALEAAVRRILQRVGGDDP